jgi:hypothetical protein
MVRDGAKDERKANRRGAARLAAVQALYQMDIAGTGLNDILAEFESHWIGREVEGAQYLPAEAAFFRDVVSGVVREQRSLDPLVDKALAQGWPLKRIEAILRARSSQRRAGACRRLRIRRRRQRFRRPGRDRHGQRCARPNRTAVSCR